MRELWFGDCLDLMHRIPDGSVDMVLCDLPYEITRASFDKLIPFEPLWEHYLRVCKPNAAIVLFGAQPFTSALLMSNRRMFRYSLVWQKTSPTGHLNAKKMPLRGHEDILVFYRKLPTYNPQMTHGHPRKVASAKNRQAAAVRSNAADGNYNTVDIDTIPGYDSTSRYPTSVLTYPSDKQRSNLHPQQKPVALLENLIRTYTNPGELVLDNACGSGSTGEAAEKSDRQCILIENKQVHYDRADTRLPNFEKPIMFS